MFKLDALVCAVLAVVYLAFAAHPARAELIEGGVTELGSGNALSSFLIAYDSATKVVAATGRTRSSGSPYSMDLPAGTYDFYVRAFGYAPVERVNVQINGPETINFEIDPGVGLSAPTFLSELSTRDIAIFAPSPGQVAVIEDSTVVELTATKALASPVYIYNEFARMKVNGQVLGVIELYDDGTNGDAMAGDLVYSRGGIGFDSSDSYESCNSFTSAFLLLGRLSGSDEGIIALPDTQQLIGVADDYEANIRSEEGLQWTDHAVNLVMDTEALEGTDWIPQVSERFYRDFADDYDFLYLFPEWVFSIGAAFMTVISNEATGIGLELMDQRDKYGSNGPLSGIVASRFSSAPPLLHETMHRWANYLNPPFGGCCHWLYSDVQGLLGGFQRGSLVDNQNGTYTVDGLAPQGYSNDAFPYAPLELYLAGLAPIESVPAVNIAVNPVDTPTWGTFSADEILNLTGADLVALFGPRVPEFGASQTAFRAAMVGVSSKPLNAATMTYIDRLAQQFSGEAFGCGAHYDFTEATNGAGSMSTWIEKISFFNNGFEPTENP